MKLIPIFLALLPVIVTGAATTKAGKAPAIQWEPCEIDLGFEQDAIKVPIDCAKLDVPFDYTDPDSRDIVQLQLIKINATKAPFKGSIIFNPGGPGASGVEDLAIVGPIYHSVVGKNFDLISFDPRGTGKTIPFNCNLTWGTPSSNPDLTSRELAPRENMTTLLLKKDWQDCTELADQCYRTQNQTGSLIGTAFAARDIMQIVDALDEDGMLRYYGTSYGTMLGATIASMFPNRIDRMYLDSVVNPHYYMSGLNLDLGIDSDKALLGFFEECVKSGPTYCAIANFSGPSTTAHSLLASLYAVFEDLIENPQYLPPGATTFSWNKDPPLSLYEAIKSEIFSYLYAPTGWPIISSTLMDTLAFNYSQYLTVENITYEGYSEGVDALWGISCSDASYRVNTPEGMIPLVKKQQQISGFSDVVQPNWWPCYQWKMSAAERYTGNFSVNASYPILLTNSRYYDPITPYVSAVNMSKGFEGSVLVTHGGHGHSWFSDPSLCIARIIKAYFENDAPAFEINLSSLYGGNFSDRKRSTGGQMSEDDIDLLQAMHMLAKYSWERLQRFGVGTGVGGLV